VNVRFALFPGGKNGVAGASTADGVELEGLRHRLVGGYRFGGEGGKCTVLGYYGSGGVGVR
jgi:hypothetical protein